MPKLMGGTKLTFSKLLKGSSKMTPENDLLITDIGYNIRTNLQTKGIVLCLNLWPDSKLRLK